MGDEVKIDVARFLSRLTALDAMLRAQPDSFGSCLQLCHGKRSEAPGDQLFVVSMQVRGSCWAPACMRVRARARLRVCARV